MKISNMAQSTETAIKLGAMEKFLEYFLPIALTVIGVACGVIWNRLDVMEERNVALETRVAAIQASQLTKDDLKDLRSDLNASIAREMRMAVLESQLERAKNQQNKD